MFLCGILRTKRNPGQTGKHCTRRSTFSLNALLFVNIVCLIRRVCFHWLFTAMSLKRIHFETYIAHKSVGCSAIRPVVISFETCKIYSVTGKAFIRVYSEASSRLKTLFISSEFSISSVIAFYAFLRQLKEITMDCARHLSYNRHRGMLILQSGTVLVWFVSTKYAGLWLPKHF